MSSASPFVHLKRAFSWNLGIVSPSPSEVKSLAAAGVTDPAAVRYAAWRRSLLLVALLPTTLAFGLAVWDTIESGFGELTRLGIGLEIAWLVAAGGLAIACLIGVVTWTRPDRTSRVLAIAWLTTFLLPFIYALLPVNSIYHVHEIATPIVTPAKADPKAKVEPKKVVAKDEEDDENETPVDPATLEKLQAMQELTVEFVLSGSGYLLLLPAVLSIIPGAVNGCLRIKALLPASQLPGWLLVCAAPAFLLFWVVILVVANHAARSPLLIFGVLFWAGAPIWYSVFGRVFVRSQIDAAQTAQIGRVKRFVLFTTLLGIGLLITFVLTTKIAGLHVVGFDREKSIATKLEKFSEDDELSLEDVQLAVAESKSFIYAFDLSNWRFVVDFLAKLLVVTAVFADLILRATLSAWANDRSFRSGKGAPEYDDSAASLTDLYASKTNG